MAELSNLAAQRLLLLMAGYGRTVSSAMADVSPDPDLVSNVAIVTLCTLDLEGPCRPGALQELTGLSSGGVSKLLDRMEQAGVVTRSYGRVPGDNRGVVVTLTRRGRTLVARFAKAFAARLPETRALVKEIAGALDE